MDILIGLIPALAWGIQPVSATKMGGKPVNQIVGMTVGTILVGLAVMIYAGPEITAKTFTLSALSGAFWVIGQIGQFYGYTRIGVAGTMPISAGLQLVGTSLIGMLVFGEWGSTTARIVGCIALLLVIVGVAMTAWREKKGAGGIDKTALLVIFLTNFGYLAYSTIPKVVNEDNTTMFFPQTIGMVLAAIAYAVFSKKTEAFKQATTWKNILTGLIFSVGALTYIYSAQANGVATGFVLGQLSVVVSTILGIYLLGEDRTPRELKLTIIGLVLIVVGAVTTGFLN